MTREERTGARAVETVGMVVKRYLDSQEDIAVCTICGGKYRPAGGPCIHEHPPAVVPAPGAWARSAKFLPEMYAAANASGTFAATCGQCGVSWYPGHACIRQPTAQEVQDMREQAYWCRVLEDVLDHFGYETQLAAPEAWEAV